MDQQTKELECLRDVVRNNIQVIKGCLVEAEKRFDSMLRAIEVYQGVWHGAPEFHISSGGDENKPDRDRTYPGDRSGEDKGDHSGTGSVVPTSGED